MLCYVSAAQRRDGVRILVSGFSRMAAFSDAYVCELLLAEARQHLPPSAARALSASATPLAEAAAARELQVGRAALASVREEAAGCVRKQLLLDNSYCRSAHLRSSRYCCRSSCSTRWARPNAATRCAWRGCAVSVRARLAAVSSARVDARTSELEGAGREALRPRAARVRVRRLRPSNGC